MADEKHRVDFVVSITGGDELKTFVDKVVQPLATLQERLSATATAFDKFNDSLPTATKLNALGKLGEVFESFSKLPSASVLKKRADSMEDLGRALSTLGVAAGGQRAKQLQEVAIGVTTLAQATKSVTPTSGRKVQQMIEAATGVQFAKLNPEAVKDAGQSIRDFGLDIAAIDPKSATNLNKFSVGIKNIIKLLDTDLPDQKKLENLRTMGRSITDALKPLTKLGELKIGSGIQQTVGGISMVVDTLMKMDLRKVKTGRMQAIKDVAYDLADVLEVFAKIPRPKGLNLVGGAISGIVGAINVVATVDVSATQLESRWQAISNVGRYVATALKQFDGVKRPENLAFVGTAVRGIIDAADAVNKGNIDPGIISIKWAKLVIAAKYVATAMKRFSGITLPPGIEHMGETIRETIELVAYANRSTVSSKDVVKNWIKIELAATLMSRALKKFDKIERPENIQAAGYTVRAIAEIMREIGELPKNAISGLKFWRESVAKDLGGIIRGMANAFKRTNKLDPAKVNATAEAIRAIATLIQSMPTATSELDEGTVTTWRRLDDFFDEVAKGFKKLAKIRIPTNLGNLALGLKELAEMGGDFSMIENSMKGLGRGGGGAFGMFQPLVDSVVNTVTFVPRKINELAVKLIPGLGKIEDLLGNMFSGALGTGGKIVQSAFKLGGNIASRIADGIKGGIGKITSALKSITGVFASILSSARNFGNQMASSFNTAGQALLQISRTSMQVGQQLLNSPLSLNRVLKSQALSTVADYESIIKQIEVLGGVQGDQLGSVNEFLLQLGADSVFSAGQAAEAFLDLSKSGLSVQDSMTALPEIMNLAAAGNVSIADSASLVINAVGAYGKTFEDTTEIVDSFAAAANVSTAEVADLATGFSYAAPSAAAFGVDMNTLNAALALMTDRGLEASKAGTGFRALLNNFLAPTDKAIGAMEELGLSFYDTEGNARDFAEILADIGRVLEEGTEDTGMEAFSEEARNSILDAIGGSANATTALLTLLDTAEDGTLTLEQYTEAMKDSASAADIGAALMDTFQGSIEAFQGSIETLLIKALTPLINHFLRPMVDMGTEVVNFFSSLPSPILSVATALFGVVSAGITLAGSFSILAAIITGPLGTALLGISGTLFAILNPLKLIAMVATAGVFSGALLAGALALSPVLVAVGAAFYDISNAIRSAAAAPHIEALQTSIGRLKDAVMGLYRPFKRVGGFILQFLFGGTGDSAEGENRTTNAVINIIDTITGFIDSLYDSVMDLRDIGYGFSQFFDILDAMAEGGGALGTIENRWKSLFKFLSGNSIAEMLIGKDFSQAQMIKFFQDFEQGMIRIRTIIQDVAGAFSDFFISVLEGENIGKALGTLFSDIGDAVDFKAILNTVVNGLISAATTLGNAALLGIEQLINFALPADLDFSGTIDSIKAGLDTAVTGADAVWDLATSGLVNVRKGWLEHFLENKDAIAVGIKAGLSFVLLNLGNLGIDLVDMIGIPGFDAENAKTEWATLTDDIADALGSTIADAIGIVLGTDDEGIAAAFDSLNTSVSGFIDSIIEAVSPITDTLAGNIEVLFGSIGEAFASLKDLDTDRIVELLTKLAEGPVMDGLKILAGSFAILFEANLAVINGFISMIPEMIKLVNALLNGDWSGAGEAIKGMFGAFVDGITDMVMSIDEGILAQAEDTIYAALGLIPEFARKAIGFDEEYDEMGKRVVDRVNEAAYKATEEARGSENFIVDLINAQLEDAPNLIRTGATNAMVDSFYQDWVKVWEDAGLEAPVEQQFDAAVDALESYLPQQDFAGLVGALIVSPDFQLDDAAAQDVARGLFTMFEGYTEADFSGFRATGDLAAEAFANGFVQSPWLDLKPTEFIDYTPVDYETLFEAAPDDEEALSKPIDNAVNAMQRFRDADSQSMIDFYDNLSEKTQQATRDAVNSFFGEGASEQIALNIKGIVDEADRMEEVDWSTLASTMQENAPIITEQAGIVQTAFLDLQTAVDQTLAVMQTSLPAIKALFQTNFDAILAKELEVENSLRSLIGGLLVFKLQVAEQLPAIRQSWVTEFGLMAQAVGNLLTPLGQVANSVNGLGVGGMSVNTGGFPPPEKRAKGGPVMRDRLYEVAENQQSELLNIGGRSFLIPGANGYVQPAESGRVAAGSVPGVQAAGEMVSGGGMSDPLVTVAEVLRHIEAMTAQIEINTSIHSTPDWFNKFWTEYVQGMWVKTVEKLWTQFDMLRGSLSSVSSAAGGGGGGYGGGGVSASDSGSSAGGTGGSAGGGAAPASSSSAGQSSWWGSVTTEQPFGDKFHAPTGTTEFVDFTANKGGMYAPSPAASEKVDPMYGAPLGMGYAFGGSRVSRMAHRVGENMKPELFQIGGRNYLIPGAGGGKITPLKELAAGPGMQNLRGMGYNNVGRPISIVEGDIHVSIQANTNASAADIASKVRDQVSQAQQTNRQRVQTTLRAAGRV